ncbi:MAG: archaellum operon transcriptional activator EarA family protein [Methanocella sp.]
MSAVPESGINKSVARLSRRRSKVRTKILLHMYTVGKDVSVKDISGALDYCYSIIYGALIGNGTHYSEKFSLRSVGLVEAKDFDGNLFFSLTENGRNEVRLIKEEGGSIDRDIGAEEEI